MSTNRLNRGSTKSVQEHLDQGNCFFRLGEISKAEKHFIIARKLSVRLWNSAPNDSATIELLLIAHQSIAKVYEHEKRYFLAELELNNAENLLSSWYELSEAGTGVSTKTELAIQRIRNLINIHLYEFKRPNCYQNIDSENEINISFEL